MRCSASESLFVFSFCACRAKCPERHAQNETRRCLHALVADALSQVLRLLSEEATGEERRTKRLCAHRAVVRRTVYILACVAAIDVECTEYEAREFRELPQNGG
jgi:hypothetical protein